MEHWYLDCILLANVEKGNYQMSIGLKIPFLLEVGMLVAPCQFQLFCIRNLNQLVYALLSPNPSSHDLYNVSVARLTPNQSTNQSLFKVFLWLPRLYQHLCFVNCCLYTSYLKYEKQLEVIFCSSFIHSSHAFFQLSAVHHIFKTIMYTDCNVMTFSGKDI